MNLLAFLIDLTFSLKSSFHSWFYFQKLNTHEMTFLTKTDAVIWQKLPSATAQKLRSVNWLALSINHEILSYKRRSLESCEKLHREYIK